MDILDSGRLVTDLNRKKACKRFEIQQLECQLKALLFKEQDYISSISDAALLCENLYQCYQDLFLLLKERLTGDFPDRDDSRNDYLSWRECYEEIERLKIKFYTAYTEEAEWKITAELAQQYHHFFDIIEQYCSVQNSTPSETQAILKDLAGARGPDEWLQTLVVLASDYEDLNTKEFAVHMAQLDARDLQNLSEVYTKKNYIDLFNAVFFYKLNPEQLFEQTVHPEKLISIKFRLCFIYDFIKAIHSSVSHALLHKNFPVSQDYLFQGDVLPPGIEIKLNGDFREIVLTTIKSWRANISSLAPKINSDYLQEILRAYKFWFNPSRLIDAVMGFQRKCAKQKDDRQSISTLYQHIRDLYKKMSTTECLDLYGYFSNKDSCYFMRTLLLIKDGKKMDWLPQLNDLGLDAINRSYDALACVMNALREELEERDVQTKSYKHHLNSKKTLTPGKRNRNAVLRIIQLYQEEEIKPNKRIEELFKQLDLS